MASRAMRLLLVFIAAIASLTASAAANGPSPFQRGQAFYESGDYAEAVKAYNEALNGQRISSGLMHNMGNAEFKLGHVGRAILAWERARSLDPNFRNSVANLHFARSKAGLEEPRVAWHEKYSSLMRANGWIFTAIVAFWVAVGFLALPHLLRRRRNVWTQVTAVAGIVVFLLTTPALLGIVSRGKVGVIVASDTDLRLTPTSEGEVLGRLPEGELARIEKARGEFVYIRGSSDRAGWVRRSEFSLIWPR